MLVWLRVQNKFANAKIFAKFTQTKYMADLYSAYIHMIVERLRWVASVGQSVSIRSPNPDQLVGKK